MMAQPLLWVPIDVTSDSSGRNYAEKTASSIRSHAQCHRRKQYASSSHADSTCVAQVGPELDRTPNVLAQSLKPSRTLGRLAKDKKRPNSIRKRRNVYDNSEEIFSSSPTPSLLAPSGLASSLSDRWPDLCASEKRSLAFFELRTAWEWSGWEDAHFWTVLALQMSRQSQAVAHSLIAISCLHEQMETVGHANRTQLQDLSSRQSAEATKMLMARWRVPYAEALVSCIIMFCLHGIRQGKTPFPLLRSGLRLLEECKSGHDSESEQDLVGNHLRPLFHRLLSRPCRMADIGGAFRQSVRLHRARFSPGSTASPLVEPSFNTLVEARQSLQRIFDWGHDNVPLEAEGAQQGEFLEMLHRLRDAWEAAMARSQSLHNARSARSRDLLQAACIIGVIIIATASSTQEQVFDSYEQDFEHALALIERAGSLRRTADFGIDSGLIDMIVFLGSKCRHPHYRRRALRLLKDSGRSEGDRISSTPAAILEGLIALEERGLVVSSSCDIPESSRRRLLCGKQYARQRRIDLFYEPADGSCTDEFSVPLGPPYGTIASRKSNASTTLPDAVFRSGYAAYLEDRQLGTYFCLEMERFYFPLPKI